MTGRGLGGVPIDRLLQMGVRLVSHPPTRLTS